VSGRNFTHFRSLRCVVRSRAAGVHMAIPLLDHGANLGDLDEVEALVERPLLQKPFYISKRRLRSVSPVIVDYDLLLRGRESCHTDLTPVGAIFHKIGRNGSIHERFVRLSEDFRYLVWEGSWFSRKPKEQRSGDGDYIFVIISLSGPLSLPASEWPNDQTVRQLRAPIQRHRRQLLLPRLRRRQVA
jgi:hypothetical protein